MVAVWWHLFKFNIKTSTANQPASRSVSLLDQLYLSLWIGAKPHAFRMLPLHRFARSEWITFVFPQEQRHWHTIQNPDAFIKQRAILGDKRAFATELAKQSINVIPTVAAIAQGQTLTPQQIIKLGDCFIKPRTGHASIACLQLVRHDEGHYLYGRDLEMAKVSTHSISRIVEIIQSAANHYELLVQPILHNHSCFQQLCLPHIDQLNLITIRLITYMPESGTANMLLCFLEVPIDREDDIRIIQLNPRSGTLNEPQEGQDDLLSAHWPAICTLCIRAHSLFESLRFVAWDLAITPEGPIVIEGNWGWGLRYVQLHTQQPLLQGTMLAAYAESVLNKQLRLTTQP